MAEEETRVRIRAPSHRPTQPSAMRRRIVTFRLKRHRNRRQQRVPQHGLAYFFLHTPSYVRDYEGVPPDFYPVLPACQRQLLPSGQECLAMARWLADTTADYAATGVREPWARLKHGSRLRAEAEAVKEYTFNDFFERIQAYLTHPDSSTPRPRLPDCQQASVAAFLGSFAADSPLRRALPWQEPWTLFTGESPHHSLVLWDAVERSRESGGARVRVPVQLSTSWHPNVGIFFAACPGDPAYSRGGLVVLHYVPGQGRIYGHYVDEIYNEEPQEVIGDCECEVLLQPGLEVAFLREERLFDMGSVPLHGFTREDTPCTTYELAVYHVYIHGTEE